MTLATIATINAAKAPANIIWVEAHPTYRRTFLCMLGRTEADGRVIGTLSDYPGIETVVALKQAAARESAVLCFRTREGLTRFEGGWPWADVVAGSSTAALAA